MSIRPRPRIKFIWGGAKVIQGRWYAGLFGFYNRIPGMPDSGLAISVRGILGWLGVLLAMGYVAAASALYTVFWKKNPYSRLTWTDAVLYPLRRDEITRKKGQAFLEQGQALWGEKRYHDAANLLRLGLARYPDDFEARRTLATFYVMANQRALAVEVLRAGLGSGALERARLDGLFKVARESEDFAAIAETCARARGAIAPADRRWLFEHEFAALTQLERHAEALALAEQAEDGESAREARVVALLALGRANDALAFLESWARSGGMKPGGAVSRLRARAGREARRFDVMDQALAEVRAAAPAEPAPVVFAVVQRTMGGRTKDAHANFDDFLFRFGGSIANLLVMAEGLGQVSDVALLERCVAAAQERGYALGRFQSLLVEAQLQRGNAEGAGRTLGTIPKSQAPEGAGAELWREWAQRVIDVGVRSGDGGGVALSTFMRQRLWPAAMFRKTLEALRAAGRTDVAREVLVLAERTFPASPWFKAEAGRLDRQAAARSTEPLSKEP